MKHCILVKYIDEVNEEKKQDLILEITEVFAPLKEMEGIEEIEVIPNVINRSNRYDLLIRITMEESALPAYDQSAPHHKWKDEYAKYLAKKAIFDYE